MNSLVERALYYFIRYMITGVYTDEAYNSESALTGVDDILFKSFKNEIFNISASVNKETLRYEAKNIEEYNYKYDISDELLIFFGDFNISLVKEYNAKKISKLCYIVRKVRRHQIQRIKLLQPIKLKRLHSLKLTK